MCGVVLGLGHTYTEAPKAPGTGENVFLKPEMKKVDSSRKYSHVFLPGPWEYHQSFQ